MNQQAQQQFLAIKRQCDLQSQIRKLIYTDNQAECEFFYNTDEIGKTVLTVVTINPKHQEMFTLHQTSGYDTILECLDEVMIFLKNLRTPAIGNPLIPYQVTWYKRSEHESNTSTFYVKNFRELTDKFFENKNIEDYVIQTVQILPTS